METVVSISNRASPRKAPCFLPRARRHKSSAAFRCLFLLVAYLWTASLSYSDQLHPTESQVKAAYLYNFGKFVRWQGTDHPPSSGSLEICILGKDPFGDVLDSTVYGESIDGRKIAVRRISRVQEAVSCNILYISLSEESRLASILSSVQHFAPLTVSDIPNFAQRGGIIAFVAQKGKIRFEVNRLAAEQSHVTLSSELLKVAVKVIDTAGPPNQP